MKKIGALLLTMALAAHGAAPTLNYNDAQLYLIPSNVLQSNFLNSVSINWTKGDRGRLTGFIPSNAPLVGASLGIGTPTPGRSVHVIGSGIISERTNADPHLVLRLSGTTVQDWNLRVANPGGWLSFRDNSGTVKDPVRFLPDADDDSLVVSTNGVFVGGPLSVWGGTAGTNRTILNGPLTIGPVTNALGNGVLGASTPVRVSQSLLGTNYGAALEINSYWNTTGAGYGIWVNNTNIAQSSFSSAFLYSVNGGTAWSVRYDGEMNCGGWLSMYSGNLNATTRFSSFFNIDNDADGAGGNSFRITSGSASYGLGTRLFEVITSGTTRLFGSLVLPNTNGVLTAGSYTNTVPDAVVYVGLGSTRTNWLNSNTATNGTLRYVKDTGTATGTNIIVKPISGNIDGAATYTISANYGAILTQWDGTNWWILSKY